MSSTTHIKPASRLREGDRILLKDLRILTVSTVANVGATGLRVSYRELADKGHHGGTLEVTKDQSVKTLCAEVCPICRTLDELI